MAHEASSKRDRDEAHLQGHWLLAKLGKKVLRPGGKKLTNWMIDNANPTNKRVVEFAPGLGITAAEILDRNPKTYTGVDQDPDAATATTLSTKQARLGIPTEVINGVASDTGLPAGSADLVVGEAMLTMQGEKGKAAIVPRRIASWPRGDDMPFTSCCLPLIMSIKRLPIICARLWPQRSR